MMRLRDRGRASPRASGWAARPLLLALGATALAVIAHPAAARQVEPSSASPDPEQVPPAQSARGTTQVEEVVVTARRRAENIQDTPVSVTAISPTQLEAAAAPNIQDLEGLTPNLVIDANNVSPNSASIAIRGISFEDIEKSFDPAVGVLLDGVYLGTNNGALLNFFDFESVEILRGPQGTLFGRNTSGGVINIRRSRPTGELGARARLVIGDYGRLDQQVVVNAPIQPDRLAIKGFYFSNKLDGFYENPIKRRDSGRQKSESFGASLLFTPTDTFDALLTVEHGHDGGEVVVSAFNRNTDLICLRLPLGPGGALVRVTGIPEEQCNRQGGEDLYTDFTNDSNDTSLNRDAVTLEANLELGNVTLTSVTGYIGTDENVFWDVDGTSITFFATQRKQDYHQFSQEFRAAGDIGETINYVAGLYYFHSEYTLFQDTRLGAFLGGARSTQNAAHNAQSYAVFADVDWKVTDRLRLSVGGRYTQDRKKLANSFVGQFRTSASDSWQEFTPRVSLDYRFTDDILAYASYARGYRSGGFNGRSSTAISSITPYDPEIVSSYEAGLKTTSFDNRLTLNVAAFHTKYDDKQEEIVVPTPGGANPQETLVSNAASATIKGLEFDATAVPVDNLTVRASLGLLDAEYDEFPSRGPTGAPIDLSTLTLRRTPEITGSISGDYEIPTSFGDFMLSAQYRYIDEYQTTISRAPGIVPFTNDPRGLTDVQHNVEASIGYSRETPQGKLRLAVFGRNLLDDRGLSSALPVAGLFTFGSPRSPRTYGVELGFEF
jgi:iron complex outermembrane receptor protein